MLLSELSSFIRNHLHLKAPAALPPEKDPIPILQKAGWALGPVWTDVKERFLAPTGLRTPSVQSVASRYTD